MRTSSTDQWPDDRLLLKSLQAGSKKGLEGLYHRYYGSLVAFSRRFTGDEDAARDVVQEVFFRLWKNRKNLKLTASVKAYLFRSVRNQSLNLLRDSPGWKSLDDPDATHPIPAEPTTFVGNDADAERMQRIAGAVARLPLRARTVFELARYEGLTYAEIAAYMNISEKTVENHLRSAMHKLREWLCQLLLLAILGKDMLPW